MTPQEQGRHCASCNKVVVDFTKKKKEEISSIMENATGKVCGHFNLSQLSQKEQQKVFLKPTNIFNRNWKYFLLAAFGFFNLNKKADAQLKGKVALRGDVAPVDYHNVNTDVTKISGTVKNSDGKSVANAHIAVRSGEKLILTANTNANGTYAIKIQPGKIVNNKISILVTHPDYESKNVDELYISKAETKLNITLEMEYMIMGEVMYVPPVLDSTEKLPEIIEPKDTAEAVNTTCTETYDTTVATHTENTTNIETNVQNTDSTSQSNDERNFVENSNNLVVRVEDIESTIFPNPAGTYATVYCNKTGAYIVEIFDAKGTAIQNINFNGSKVTLDVSKYDRGTYFVMVRGENGFKNTLKLVKN